MMGNLLIILSMLYLILMHQQQFVFHLLVVRSFSISSLICTEAERFLGNETTATAVCLANAVWFES